ncbi:MAG: hypothetical protein IPN45_15130 [Actinomycetales bacterium]|nr:hypothetical protein [Actinomycetales bacterium]
MPAYDLDRAGGQFERTPSAIESLSVGDAQSTSPHRTTAWSSTTLGMTAAGGATFWTTETSPAAVRVPSEMV